MYGWLKRLMPDASFPGVDKTLFPYSADARKACSFRTNIRVLWQNPIIAVKINNKNSGNIIYLQSDER